MPFSILIEYFTIFNILFYCFFEYFTVFDFEYFTYRQYLTAVSNFTLLKDHWFDVANLKYHPFLNEPVPLQMHLERNLELSL